MLPNYGYLRAQVSRNPGVQLAGPVTMLYRYIMDCTEQLASIVAALSASIRYPGLVPDVNTEEILQKITKSLLALRGRFVQQPVPGLVSWIGVCVCDIVVAL